MRRRGHWLNPGCLGHIFKRVEDVRALELTETHLPTVLFSDRAHKVDYARACH
jgi:hypothetical protein